MSWRAYLTVSNQFWLSKDDIDNCFTKNELVYTIRKTLIIAHCSDTLFSSKYWTSWRKRQRSAVSAVICWTNNKITYFCHDSKILKCWIWSAISYPQNLHWWDKVIKIKLNWTGSTQLTFARLCLCLEIWFLKSEIWILKMN